MQTQHTKHIVLLLIRHQTNSGVAFLYQPMSKWQTPDGLANYAHK
jgi:hypothetical protein